MICMWPSWCHCHSLSLAPINPDWFTFLVPAYPGIPGQKAIKRVLLLLFGMNYIAACCIVLCSLCSGPAARHGCWATGEYFDFLLSNNWKKLLILYSRFTVYAFSALASGRASGREKLTGDWWGYWRESITLNRANGWTDRDQDVVWGVCTYEDGNWIFSHSA